jgi:hypothetical protein
MLSFKEFIIKESYDLIIESDVRFSNNFIAILKKMTNPLAKSIIDLDRKDLPVTNNFFEINPDDNSKVFFIPDRKGQEMLKSDKKHVRFIGGNGGWLKHSPNNEKIFKEIGYVPKDTAYRPNSQEIGVVINTYESPTSGKIYNYVKFNNGEGVYNLDKLEEVIDITSKLFGLGKQELNVGRAMRALLTTAKITFSNKELEDFVNEYKSKIDLYGGIFSKFDIVSGDDIAYWYNQDNYAKKNGTLGSSCMSNVSSDFFEIYTKNPEVCSLLILKDKMDDTKIVGRALLWNLNNGKIFLDRIYTNNDSDVALFREYSKANKWYYKKHNDSSNSEYVINSDGEEISLTIEVFLKKSSYNYYPYVDTLKYFDTYRKRLSIYENIGSYLLEDTGGEAIYCETCGGSGKEECDDCSGSGNKQCYRCDGSGKEECDECDGHGKVECDECSGAGTMEDDEGDEIACTYCDETGYIKCNDCGGNGDTECGICDGDGEYSCENCDGEGEIDCTECS